MMTFEQTLDQMQRDAGPLAALVFVSRHVVPGTATSGFPEAVYSDAFRVVTHERRSDAERDEDHAGNRRWWLCEVTL